MENTYGIGVKNRYELFYDEDVDPLEIIREREEAKEKKKTDKTQTKEKTKSTTKAGKTNSAAGLLKKPKESPPTSITKPVETPEVPNKSRTRQFPDRSAKSPRNTDDSKDLEERKNFRNRDDHAPANSDTRDRGDGEMRRGRGGFRGRGRPRGGRGNFFNSDNRPPRREFDRHSGSDKAGLRPVEKKDGAGSNNWGDMRSEFSSRKREPETTWDEEFESSGDKQNDSNWDSMPESFTQQSSNKEEVPADKPTDETTNENNELKENQPVGEENTAEGMKEMTLDEWKKEQEAKRVVPKYNLRKPGEGEDGNQWKKLYMYKKKAKEDGEEDDEEEEDEDVDDDEFARRGRQRQLVDIQINFNDSRRGRGRARGGRGGGGGGIGPRSGGGGAGPVGPRDKEIFREERRDPLPPGGNVGGRSYRSMKMNKSGQQSAPRVDDWNDFPSLVTA